MVVNRCIRANCHSAQAVLKFAPQTTRIFNLAFNHARILHVVGRGVKVESFRQRKIRGSVKINNFA